MTTIDLLVDHAAQGQPLIDMRLLHTVVLEDPYDDLRSATCEPCTALLSRLPEVAPPENVLFVCKLNPVTQAEDLELIFSPLRQAMLLRSERLDMDQPRSAPEV